MFVYVPHRKRNREIPLEPGERKLSSWHAGAGVLNILMAAFALLGLAAWAVSAYVQNHSVMIAVSSALAASAGAFGAQSKLTLTLTNKRLLLRRRANEVQGLALSDIVGIDVGGKAWGKIRVSGKRGEEMSASVYSPLKVAAEIQAACAAQNEESDVSFEGGRA